MRSPVRRMNGRISLILFGIFVTLAILCAAENSEENSLSEEVSASRLARSAEAGRKKDKSLKKKRRKTQKSKKAAKKAAKKSKKNKRKTKKNKRKAKKNKKKAKKNKRNQKRKSNQPSNKKNKKNKSKDRSQDGKNWPLDGHCVECAASGMYRWRTVVANFAKQKNRIEKQAGITSSKKGKNTMFAPIALKLMDVGGGNKSALKCANSTTSNGAKQLTNLTQTLFECEAKLNESCAAVEVNMTFVDECAKDIELFENMTKDCYDLSKSDTAIAACFCWINETYRDLGNKIKSCKIEETMNVTDGLKACKKVFSTCRQAEDDAVAAIAACSVSEDTLKTKAATLAANVNITSSCSAKVAGITGSGAVPRAAASNCSEFITLMDKCRFTHRLG